MYMCMSRKRSMAPPCSACSISSWESRETNLGRGVVKVLVVLVVMILAVVILTVIIVAVMNVAVMKVVVIMPALVMVVIVCKEWVEK